MNTYDDLKPSEPKEFPRELPKAGWHVAICAQVHSLGYQKFGTEVSSYPQAAIVFELAAKRQEGDHKGKPFLVSVDVSNMLPKPGATKKGRLAELLSNWEGREYTTQDKEFTLRDLVGKNAFLNIIHKDGYANVGSIGPLPEGMNPIAATVTEIPPWVKAKKEKQVAAPAMGAHPSEAPPHGEDDLPF